MSRTQDCDDHMTLPEIARFLDNYPDWTLSFGLNAKGEHFIDGFLNFEGHYVTLRAVQRMLSVYSDEGDLDCV